MAKKQKDPIVLTHEGKEYTDMELRKNQEAYVAFKHIENENRKIGNSIFNHEALIAAKTTFENRLVEALKEPEEAEAEEVEAEA